MTNKTSKLHDALDQYAMANPPGRTFARRLISIDGSQPPIEHGWAAGIALDGYRWETDAELRERIRAAAKEGR